MPRYKLVVQDASGKSRSATVEAASQAAAVDIARRKGFQVRQIEPVYDLADDAPPPEPPETPDVPDDSDEPAPSSRRGGRPVGGRPNLVFLILPTALAAVALLISAVTFVYVVASDPFGSGLRKYDFSDARRAYKSQLEMEKNVDFRAMVDYRRRFGDRTAEGRKAREKLDSYELKKEVEFGSRKGLLVTYKAGGEVKREVVWFEKDEATGYWIESDVTMTDLLKRDKELAEVVAQFLSTGEVPKK